MTIQLRPEAALEHPIEFAFSDHDFRMISDLAKTNYGLHLQQSKKALVYSRLARRLRVLKLESFREYCDLLSGASGKSEHTHLLSALTTNVTHFFREKHHFDHLKSDILPGLIERARAGSPVRIWSAACSAGQEAYCIAAVVAEVCPDAHRLDIKILATDVDPNMIERALTGVYPIEQLAAIPQAYHAMMVTSDRRQLQMQAKLRDLISFGELNLIAEWPMRRTFDVIFCRNVAIYFDHDTQARLWQRFADALNLGGHLMIGHSERLSGPAAARFANAGVTSYIKTHSQSDNYSNPEVEK